MPEDQKDKEKRDASYPSSPGSLEVGGLRGRIAGVTRVGPKAVGLAIILILALIGAILWGINKPAPAPNTSLPPPLTVAPPAHGEAHFGQDVPIIGTPEPTEAPIVLPTNPVPSLTPVPLRRGAGAGATSPPDQSREAERRRRREILDQAIHSKIIASENAVAGASGGDTSTCIDATGKVVQQSVSQGQQPPQPAAPNSRDFLNGPVGQYSCAAQLASADTARQDYLPSRRAAPMSQYELLAGSIIPAALITGINSDLPGLITAQVREDVYDSKTGRYLVIPKGSRLLGVYRSGIAYGQSRVLVAWSRLIYPDTSGIDLLNMSGADVEGNAGLAGTVNNHTGKLFGAALLLSLLTVGTTISQPQQTGLYPNPGQLASAQTAQQIAQIGTQLVNRDLGISPTIMIPKGYPFVVIVDRDIVFPGPYQGT